MRCCQRYVSIARRSIWPPAGGVGVPNAEYFPVGRYVRLYKTATVLTAFMLGEYQLQ